MSQKNINQRNLYVQQAVIEPRNFCSTISVENFSTPLLI